MSLDRLLHVPNAVPPEPQDYVPRPTHPINHVPYGIAAAWELRVRAEVETRTAALARRKQALTRTLGDKGVSGRVPRELCQRAKKTPAVRTWVRSLEEPVRQYLVARAVVGEGDEGLRTDDSESSSGLDSEDEEIVFVGRNGSMRDGKRKDQHAREGKHEAQRVADIGGQWKKAHRKEKKTGAIQDEGMLFDALGDEDGGAFRYVFLAHLRVSTCHSLSRHAMLEVRETKTCCSSPTGAGLPIPSQTTTACSRAPCSLAILSERSCMWVSSR